MNAFVFDLPLRPQDAGCRRTRGCRQKEENSQKTLSPHPQAYPTPGKVWELHLTALTATLGEAFADAIL